MHSPLVLASYAVIITLFAIFYLLALYGIYQNMISASRKGKTGWLGLSTLQHLGIVCVLLVAWLIAGRDNETAFYKVLCLSIIMVAVLDLFAFIAGPIARRKGKDSNDTQAT